MKTGLKREVAGLSLWGWFVIIPLIPPVAWVLSELLLVGGPF